MDILEDLDEDELLGIGGSERNLAFTEEDERRLLEDDSMDYKEEDYYNQLDYDEDTSENYNEINISENCDEFYDEEDETVPESRGNQNSNQSLNQIGNNGKLTDVSGSSLQSDSLPIKTIASTEITKSSVSYTANRNKSASRQNMYRESPPQRWHSYQNQRFGPPQLPRGPFPLHQRPFFLPRPHFRNAHRSRTPPQMLFPSQPQYNHSSGWGHPLQYIMPLPGALSNFSSAYIPPVNMTPNSNRENSHLYTPPVQSQPHPQPLLRPAVQSARSTIHVNPHFQGSVKLQPDMPRLAWHEQNKGSFSNTTSNSNFNNRTGGKSFHSNQTNSQSTHPISSNPRITQSSDKSSTKLGTGLLDTASRRRKMEESLQITSLVSPPKRSHVVDDDIFCLEDNNKPPTVEELQRAQTVGVDIAYLREYDRKQKEIKEKAAQILKEKEERRKQKIHDSKSLSLSNPAETKAIQRVSKAPVSSPQPKIVPINVKQRSSLTPQQRLVKFSSEQQLMKQQLQKAPPPEDLSPVMKPSTRTVVRPKSVNTQIESPKRTITIDKVRSVTITTTAQSQEPSRTNRIIVQPKSDILDKKLSKLRQAVCVSNLLPETAYSDLSELLRVFGKGSVKKQTNDKTKALIVFDSEEDAKLFQSRCDGVNVHGISLHVYFHPEANML